MALDDITLLNKRELPGPGVYNQLARLLKNAKTNTRALRLSRAPDGGLLVQLFPDVLKEEMGGGGDDGGGDVQDAIEDEIQDGGVIHEFVEDFIDGLLQDGGAIHELVERLIAQSMHVASHPFQIMAGAAAGTVAVKDGTNTASANAGLITCGNDDYPVSATTFSLPQAGSMYIYACIYYENGAFATELVNATPAHSQQWFARIGAVDSQGNISQPTGLDFFNLRVQERWVP